MSEIRSRIINTLCQAP